jgi:acyl carrier protein
MTVRDQVVELLQQFPAFRTARVNDAESFLESGLIDSHGMMELVEMLGLRFKVTISDDDLTPDNLDSIHAITGFLGRKGVRA